MLSDVIKKYGGEKMDPLDVYKDIFRIGEGFIQKEYEDSGSFKANPIFLELEKDSFRRSMKIVEVSKQIQSPIIRMRMKIMAILELCLKISLKKSIEMSL